MTAVDVAVKHDDRADMLLAEGSRLPFTGTFDATTVIASQPDFPLELLKRSSRPGDSTDAHLFMPLASVALRLEHGLPKGTALRVTISIDVAGRLTAGVTRPGHDKAIGGFDPAPSPGDPGAVQVPVRYEDSL